MKNMLRTLSLATLMTLGLMGCHKQVPIEEDMNQRKAAIVVAQNYMKALETNNFDKALEMSTFPYWLDGKVVKRDGLKKSFEKELSAEDADIKRLKLVRSRFYSRVDMDIFAARLIRNLEKAEIATDYFVVMQYTSPKFKRGPENLLLIMGMEEGRWVIRGIED